MPTAHCISTSAGVIMAVDGNFLKLMQRAENDLLGVSFRDLTFPPDLVASEQMLANLVDRASPTLLKKRYVRPDGSIVCAELMVSKFADNDRLVTTLFFNTDGGKDPTLLGHLWRAALQAKHLNDVRRHEFGVDLFSDHILAILIEIYLGEVEARIVSAASISRAIGMPLSTVCRWLSVLSRREFTHIIDGDESAVQFTDLGLRATERVLSAMLQPRC